MIYLISYATRQFFDSQQRLKESALKNGVDEVVSLKPVDIKNSEFYKQNNLILDDKKGAGLWLWKPYLILRQLEKIKEEDFLIYSDAGIEMVSDINPLIRLCQESPNNLVVFKTSDHLAMHYTKRDCFVLMEADSREFHQAESRIGGFIILKKNTFTLQFVHTWLKYCCDPRILSDQPNTCGLPNYEGFLGHRHDQSVLTILCLKNNLPAYRDPSQWGNHLKMPVYRKMGEFNYKSQYYNPDINSPYDTIFYIHRTRKYDLLYHLTLKIKNLRKHFLSESTILKSN